MPLEPTSAIAVAILSQPLKDLYALGKDKFGDLLSKWNNSKAVSALTTKVAAYEKVKTIWQRDKFVRLTSFYYPSRIQFSEEVTKKISSLKDLPRRGGLVIEGTVGQGKSVFLRYLCVQELKSQSSGRVPVFIELRKLTSARALEAAVYETIKTLGFNFNHDLFEFYASSGKMVLLLDGFDELEEDCVKETISTLERWAEQYPELQAIVTCRPNEEIQKSSEFYVVKLAPLNSDDHRPFLIKIGLKGDRLENLLKAIDDSPNQIKEFLNTPLLLTLLLLVYQAENQIPSELPEFFKVLFVTVLSKHDGTKPAYRRLRKSGLNERQLELLFESFCFSVMRSGFGVSLSSDQLSKSLSDGAKYVSERCDLDGFLHDMTKGACLLLEDGFSYVFAHKSLLEYFSAAFIKNRTDNQASTIYQAILNSKRRGQWEPITNFLKLIDKYRYTRLYAIPLLNNAFSVFGISDSQLSEEIVENGIDCVLKDMTLSFRKDGNNVWHASSLTGYNGINKHIDALVHRCLIFELFFIGGGADAVVQAMLRNDHVVFKLAEEGNALHISWSDLKTVIGSSNIKSMVDKSNVFINELFAERDSLIEYLENEDLLAHELAAFAAIE